MPQCHQVGLSSDVARHKIRRWDHELEASKITISSSLDAGNGSFNLSKISSDLSKHDGPENSTGDEHIFWKRLKKALRWAYIILLSIWTQVNIYDMLMETAQKPMRSKRGQKEASYSSNKAPQSSLKQVPMTAAEKKYQNTFVLLWIFAIALPNAFLAGIWEWYEGFSGNWGPYIAFFVIGGIFQIGSLKFQTSREQVKITQDEEAPKPIHKKPSSRLQVFLSMMAVIGGIIGTQDKQDPKARLVKKPDLQMIIQTGLLVGILAEMSRADSKGGSERKASRSNIRSLIELMGMFEPNVNSEDEETKTSVKKIN